MPSLALQIGGAVALTFMLCGCGGSATVQVQVHSGTTALVSGGGGQGSDAEVRGVVQVGAGGCLGIVSEGANKPIPVVWPEGSKLADDGKSIDLPDVGLVRIGQAVSGGGGEVSNPSGDRFADVPPECLDQDLLIDATKISAVS